MRRISCVLIAPFVLAVCGFAQQSFPDTCPSGKTGHFPGKATAIDSVCGPKGTPNKTEPGDAPQNKAKTNFCTSSATPTTITVEKYTELQKSAEALPGYKPRQPPKNRKPLQNLKEGNLVVFEGFIFDATQECKETVNCESVPPNTNASHDIHIALLAEPRKAPRDDDPGIKNDDPAIKAEQDKEECTGFVAEMIPHHRPPEWTSCNVKSVAKNGLRVRVTGQQFFDNSHVPCKDGVPVSGNPKRISLWEIHPIYSFEVCPSGDCASGGWQPLETFAAGQTTCPEKACE